MNLKKILPYLDAIQIGKIFLHSSSSIEAFFGNALYS